MDVYSFTFLFVSFSFFLVLCVAFTLVVWLGDGDDNVDEDNFIFYK